MDRIVCIDIGNQFLKFAEFDSDGKILQEGRMPNSELNTFLNQNEFQDSCFLICDVAQKTKNQPKSNKITVLQSNHKFPFQINYETPETLGLDRLCGISGAMFLSPKERSFLVFSLGTCLTIDFIGEDHTYYGGCISPGLAVRYQSLHHFTAGLPLLNFENTEKLIGTGTESAIHCGVQNGILSEIDFYIEHFKNKADHLCVFMTGGDTQYFVNRTKSKIFAAPNLNLFGLFHIAKLNELI